MSSANVTNKLWNYCNALRDHVINDSCAILGAFESLP